MGIIFSACTSKKACDKLDDLIDVSVHGNVIVDENVVEKVENVVEKVVDVVEKVVDVVEKVENVVEKVENVVNKV